MKVKSESEVAQSCLTLSDPMDCSLLGSSIHGIFQARVLEWGAIAFSAHASKAMLKILLAGLQHYVNQELPDVQAGFRKGSRTKYQVANICWIIEKVREFQKKTSIFVSSTTLKPLTVWIMTNYGKVLERWEYYTILPVSWDTCMEQLIGSRSRKEHDRAVCCHPVCLTCILSISGEMLGWMIYKLKSR